MLIVDELPLFVLEIGHGHVGLLLTGRGSRVALRFRFHKGGEKKVQVTSLAEQLGSLLFSAARFDQHCSSHARIRAESGL